MEEKSNIISMGSKNILTTPEGHFQLLSFFNDCKNIESNQKVYLDFKKIKWINGNMCALLTAMIYQLREENKLNFFVDNDNIIHIKTHLKPLIKNGFLIVDDDAGPDLSIVALRTFEPNDEVEFVDYIEHELFDNKRMKIDPDSKNKMIDKFLEMYSNIQIHARSQDRPVFGCGHYLENDHKLHFTLVDLGVGYLVPIEEHTRGAISTSEAAIQWALQGNTTKKDAPGGTGLIDLAKYCNDTGSDLHIITGNSYWGININDGKAIQIAPFTGTTLHMMFNCS